MANEMSYTHTMPGGLAGRKHRAYLRRYKSPHEVTRMDDFVTLRDLTTVTETIKANAVWIGLGALVIGCWWWNKKN